MIYKLFYSSFGGIEKLLGEKLESVKMEGFDQTDNLKDILAQQAENKKQHQQSRRNNPRGGGGNRGGGSKSGNSRGNNRR